MATVPVYSREVAPQVTPNKYVEAKLNQDMFGVNVSNANIRLGQAGLDALDLMVNIAKRVDETKIVELTNKSSQWEQTNLYDEQNGYLYKTGKDAYGQSENLLKDYDKQMNDYIAKAGLSPSGVRKANETLSRMKSRITQTTTQHDFEEGVKWSGMEAAAGLENYARNAINMRNNPEEIQKSLQSGYQLIEWQGKIQHKDETTIKAEKTAYAQKVNGNILDAFLAEGSLKASEFFEKNKDGFSPEAQTRYLERVHNQKINYAARETANKLAGMSEEEAYKYIDSIQNIEERDAVEREYNRKKRQEETIKNEKEKDALEKFYKLAYEKQQRGESLSYDDIPTDVDAQTKISLTRFINSNGNPTTDDDAWEELYEKSVNDAQSFANIDLNKYRGLLSDGEYKSFVKRQNEIKTGKYYTQIQDDDAMIDAALETMGLGKGKKEKVAYSEIRSMVKEIEARKGRKITDNELQSIVNSLGYKDEKGVKIYKQIEKGMGERTGFIRDVINDFSYYQSKHNGQMPSDEEKAKIINRRVNSVIVKQNNNMKTSLQQPYKAKVGDTWNGHKIKSLYGKRVAPTTGATTDHKGIDLAFANNEIFPAFASGTVVAVGKDKKLGNYVDIKGADGIIHRYGHANSILVRTGQKVRAGEGIGRAGSTGVSTGVHLHYAKIQNGKFIDPLGTTSIASAGGNKGWAF